MINFFFQSHREHLSVDAARTKYPSKYLIFEDYEPLTCEGTLAGYMEHDDIDEYNAKYICAKFKLIEPEQSVHSDCENQEDYCVKNDCNECECHRSYDCDDSDVPPRRRCRASRKPKSCVPWVVGAMAFVGTLITLRVIRRKHNA